MKKLLSILLSCLVHNELTRAINTSSAVPSGTVSAINVEAPAQDEWLTIKYGVYPNEVGLQVFNREGAEQMVSAFNDITERYARVFRGQPIYVGHPDDKNWRASNPGVREEAVGRITELRADEDGLKLKRALNEEGKRLTGGDAPAYTAFSPNWGMKPIIHQGRKAFQPVYLFSVGLCNRPQIPGTFIGLNEALPLETKTESPMNKLLIALLAALGRPVADAANITDEQLATAVNEAVPVATKLVTDAGRLTTAVNEADTLRASLNAERSEHAGLLLTTAINEGRLTEAGRTEWLGKFTAEGADFKAVAADLGKLTKAINTESQSKDLGRRRSAVPTKLVTAVNEAVTAYKTAHPGVSHQEAYDAVRKDAKHAALFTNDKAE